MRKFLVILFIAAIACTEVAEMEVVEYKIKVRNIIGKIRNYI